MKKCIPLLCVLFLVAASGLDGSRMVSAQTDAPKKAKKEKVDSIPIFGRIYDRLTSREVIGTKIEVLNPDSTVMTSTTGGYRFQRSQRTGDSYTFKKDSTSKYTINIPRIGGNYLIKVSKEGYEPYHLSYALKLNRRDDEKEIPNIYLTREKVRTLDEFTVKASKVMFYNKGDTIVYNADAFVLPEGSMLDALVAQMPGVEIKGNKIYVNGRFVESLLLNGKDFFKGNKKVMMENIGAYAVKDIAVYEKKDEMAYVLGDREDVEKEYVMDVRLKKDYMTGYMINAEAGGGTSSRYVGRLFAMQYTNNSRLALYGNANNINKSGNLSDNDMEVDIDRRDGIKRRTSGGIDYRADNSMHTWEVTGNVDASYIDGRNNVVTNAVNYLQTADTYEFTDRNSRSRDFSFATQHDFKIKKKKWNLTLKPKFSYNKNRSNDETVAAAFNEEMQGIDRDILRAIYSNDNQALRKAIINRNIKTYESDSHGYDAQFNADGRIKVPGSPDGIAIKFQTKYSRSSLFGNNLQDICYGGVPDYSTLLHQYSSVRPQYNFNIQGLGRYYFNIPVGALHASYEFAHTQTRKNSDISMMEAMADDSMAEFLPDQMPVPDYANSYTSKLYKNEHRIKLNWYYQKKSKKGKFSMAFQPNFIIENQHLFYHRGDVNADPSRTYLRFNIPEAYVFWEPKGKKWDYRLVYEMNQKAVNLVNLVDVRNTTDPLNIIVGNPDLKNSTHHYIRATVGYMRSKNTRQSFYLVADWTANDFVRGYRYDSGTGVRTMKTYNVSGNYNLSLGHSYFLRFGHNDNFFIDNDFNAEIYNYVNMIGNDAEPTKQSVNSKEISDNLLLGYRVKGKFSINLDGYAVLNNSRSDGPMITKNNNGYWSAGLSGWYNLPFNLNVHTDIRAITRFGYIENSMNSTDVLWNAGVEYSIRKGEWRIRLEARDILNQLRGVRYSVSANGRTQTLSTVLPRYLMLSVHYRFDFKPKRKN